MDDEGCRRIKRKMVRVRVWSALHGLLGGLLVVCALIDVGNREWAEALARLCLGIMVSCRADWFIREYATLTEELRVRREREMMRALQRPGIALVTVNRNVVAGEIITDKDIAK